MNNELRGTIAARALPRLYSYLYSLYPISLSERYLGGEGGDERFFEKWGVAPLEVFFPNNF
eukprot:scaffold6832_cov81-Skeletonema_menzelii.AAC.34